MWEPPDSISGCCGERQNYKDGHQTSGLSGAGEGPDYKNKRELHVVLALLHLTIVGVVTTQLPKLI